MLHENKMHNDSCFLTLTYDDEHLPPDGSLHVSHWQLFAKKLRKKIGPFRFFHCGEYGEKTGRPHYHAILFGYDFIKDRKLFKKTRNDHNLYTSELLTETWEHGFANIGEVTFDSAAYVARYIMKKQTGEEAEAFYSRPGLERVDYRTGEITGSLKPPYTTMSRRPGIGQPWLDAFHKDVYPYDECIINGKPVTPPAYYDAQLEKKDPSAIAIIKKRRQTEAAKYGPNNTYKRLRIREEIHKQKINRHLRDPQK